jgi:hypothetical protein
LRQKAAAPEVAPEVETPMLSPTPVGTPREVPSEAQFTTEDLMSVLKELQAGNLTADDMMQQLLCGAGDGPPCTA